MSIISQKNYKENATEYYSGLKKKKILPYAIIWINIEDIILSKLSQSQKHKLCDFTYMSSQTHRNRELNGVCQRLGGGENGEMLFNLKVSIMQDE